MTARQAPRQTALPTLVRMKPGALDRAGIYANRHRFQQVAVLVSSGLDPMFVGRLRASLEAAGIEGCTETAVEGIEFSEVAQLAHTLPPTTDLLIGLGGGKALDVAKYAAFLLGKPTMAFPTSLSNDGFCSPQSSLTIDGRRRSLPSAMPFGVVIDTTVCEGAPRALWLSGVGDLAAKFTAVTDWKLAFHAVGEPVDDFAALLSDASVYQFLARPSHDPEGIRRLGTALMLNGIAMAICGSSRPASGGEHLISHALDAYSARPRLHGLQVGVATYLTSLLQGGEHGPALADLFTVTGFWDAIAADPFDAAEWEEAIRRAPGIKPGVYTVFHARNCLPEAIRWMRDDPFLARCFEDRSGSAQD